MSRPRLADHVVARLHRREAEDQLVLLDAQRDRAVVLGASAWSVLCHADGTRDVAGIVDAARRFGADITVTAAERLIAELDALQWLADGAPCSLIEGEPQPIGAGDQRVIREMIAGRYRCDGRGDCCRTYPTISLTPADVHRVCATLPDEPTLAHRSHRAFMPIVGSAPTPMRAVSLVEGACRFLEQDGRCRVHREGGAAAKPIGCAWFPTRLIDDGVEVRAAPAIECVCVARPDPSAPPLLPELRVCDLPLGVTLLRVPEQVRFGTDGSIDRASAIAAIERLVSHADDPVRSLWAWGRSLERAGSEPSASAVDAAEIATRFASVAARAKVRAAVEKTWRAADDVVCRRLDVLAIAAAILAAPSVAALVIDTTGDAALERHVIDVAAFSRGLLVTGDLARATTDLALQIWLARAVTAFVDDTADVTMRETPLAAVTVTWRAQRLGH